jgi:signal transduction histidine kinase
MRLLGAFFAALLAIAAVTAASLRSLAARRESSEWVRHTQDVRVSLERVLALTADAESTGRAYLLTGREDYLVPHAAASGAISREVDNVATLIRDNPGQQQRLALLRELLKAKAETLGRAIELRRAGDVSASTATVASGKAGALMARIRTVLAAMSDEESSVLRVRLEEVSHADSWSGAVTLGGAVLLVVLAIAAAAMVRGDLRRREELADQRARVVEYQERLIGLVGHDLRNPLTALLVSAQMLAQKREELRPGQAAAVDRILRSASRIDLLATLMIDFTYARLGKGLPTHPGPMDARAVVERAVGALREANPSREIRVDAPSEVLPGAWDGDRIAQLVSILVSNALQYGATDSPVTVSVTLPDDELQIRVHNAGPAVPEEVQKRLFEPYTRGKGSEMAHPRGLGLGLFIAREIARAHGGTVEVRSGGPDGTAFTAHLPTHPPRRNGSPGGAAIAEAPAT